MTAINRFLPGIAMCPSNTHAERSSCISNAVYGIANTVFYVFYEKTALAMPFTALLILFFSALQKKTALATPLWGCC
jgi:hypothetical protein